MSLDRRIVSILYFNGIEDVESVQEFIGEQDGYFVIKINDEIKKLKIPGHEYPELEKEIIPEEPKKLGKEIKDVIDVIKEEIKEKVEDIKEDTKEVLVNVKEVFENIKEDVKEFIEDTKEDIKDEDVKMEDGKFIVTKELDDNLADGSFTSQESNDVVEFVEEKKKTTRKTTKTKKLEIVESKDDIDDFINLA